jgi:hypothetical protein
MQQTARIERGTWSSVQVIFITTDTLWRACKSCAKKEQDNLGSHQRLAVEKSNITNTEARGESHTSHSHTLVRVHAQEVPRNQFELFSAFLPNFRVIFLFGGGGPSLAESKLLATFEIDDDGGGGE